MASVPLPNAASKSDKVLVHPEQKGNPLLKYLKNWTFGDIVADYQVEEHTAILFIQLRFHVLHKDYLLPRMKAIAAMSCRLHIFLCLCDMDDSTSVLLPIQKQCLDMHFTLIVCWTSDEAAAYISSFRKYANKGPEMLKAKRETNAFAAATAALTQVRSVNKSDVANLLSTFASFKRLSELQEEDLLVCPGLGEKKVQRLIAALDAPFPGKKRKCLQPLSAGTANDSHPSVLPSPRSPGSSSSISASPSLPSSAASSLLLQQSKPETILPIPAMKLKPDVPLGHPLQTLPSVPHEGPQAEPVTDKDSNSRQRRAEVMKKGYGKMRSALKSALANDDIDEEDIVVPVLPSHCPITVDAAAANITSAASSNAIAHS